eukprot:s29_g21.t1
MRGLNTDLVQMAEEAGIEKVVLDYLRARKALSTGVLGAMARDWDEVDTILVKPILEGYTHDGVTHKVPEADAVVAKAQIRFLWKKSHDMLEGTGANTSQPPTTPPPACTPASSKQPPKELPPEILKELLSKYEEQKIDGVNREFPQRMLLGTDRILARAWWEMEHKMHTPIQLHELISARVFDAAGNPNPLAQQPDSKQNKVTLDLTSGSGIVSISEDSHWTPKGVLSLLDALEAIEWALILLRMGNEADVRAWISWWRCLVRSKTQKLEHLKMYWMQANWKICLELRQGADFATVTKQVMAEQHALQSALQKELPTAMPKVKPQIPPKQNKGGHPTGKGTSNKRWASQEKYDYWQPRQRVDPPDRSTTPNGRPLILLSAFDGIGCAKLALDAVIAKTQYHLLAYIAWEIDGDCVHLTTIAHGADHRGDITLDTSDSLVETIQTMNPNAEALILMCAGPPCPDYSRIVEGPGKDGVEGIKFEIYAKWKAEVTDKLRPRNSQQLTENVIPHRRGDIQYFEQKLGCEAVIFDAAEFKRISRPRTWWTSIKWDDPTVPQILGTNWSWKKHFGTRRLVCPQPTSEALIPEGWHAPRCWADGETLPCLTTPAPTEAGRAAPRSQKGRMGSATYHRWISDNRQYAPWHYEEKCLMQDPSGKLSIPPIETKESLHHIPVGYTAGMPDKQRHKAVANSWHVGVASLLIWLLLMQAQSTPAAASTVVPKPMASTPFQAIDMLAHWWGPDQHPGPGDTATLASHQLELVTDMWQHWHGALSLGDPAQETLLLEPHMLKTLELQRRAGSKLVELRLRVCHEVRTLVESLRPQTEEWLHTLKPHIRDLYGTTETCLQVVAIQDLTRRLYWGDPHLIEELSQGFPLLGDLAPGWGWPKRKDDRYSHPLDRAQLLSENMAYIQSKLHKHKCDPHWQTLLNEIAQDVKHHRMEGPFHGPPEWKQATVAASQFAHTQHLLQGPAHHAPTSMAFSIVQTGADGRDKIRRGEDWRRGHHNQTVKVADAPVNHRPDMFVAVARALAHQGLRAEVWGTDQEDAYRQLPVANPDDTWVILFTPTGVTLWRHKALLWKQPA